jgi:hypothetical protein
MPLRRHRRRVTRRRPSHSRRAHRRASRRVPRRNRSNRRTRRRAMYGGAQHVVRFKVVFLEDEDAYNDNEDLSDAEIVNLVTQNSNKFYDVFNTIVRELIEAGEINAEEVNSFLFTHLGENRFEMKFEVLHQGEQAQKVGQETRDLVLQEITDSAAVNINGTHYGINVEKE